MRPDLTDEPRTNDQEGLTASDDQAPDLHFLVAGAGFEPRPGFRAKDGAAASLDRRAIAAEMDQAWQTFYRLLDQATDTGLRRRSNGTKWTNEQLLFHMLFGYLITRALLVLVRIFGRLPDGASKAFARLLDTAHRPFHLINYLGSCAGARIIPYSHMRDRLDRVIAALERSLATEHDAALQRGMHYPTTWDPFFTDYMTLADLYRYPTQHFNYHREQLTLTNTG